MKYVDEGGCFTELNQDGTITIGLSKLVGIAPHPGVNLSDLVSVTGLDRLTLGANVEAGDTLVAFYFTAEAARRAGVIPDAYYYGAFPPVDGKIVWINDQLSLEDLRDGRPGPLTEDLAVVRIRPNDADEYSDYIEGEGEYLLSGNDIADGKTMADF